MNKFVALIAAAALAIGFSPPGVALADHASKDLIADNGDGLGGIDVGMVVVHDTGGSITVTYTRDVPWLIVETHTHLDLSADCSGVPQTGKGNPKVGKFAMQTPFTLPGDISVVETFTDIFPAGSTVCVAAHAVVYDDTGGLTDQEKFDLTEETAWGDGDGPGQFPGRNWATYFTFVTD